jgi:hypothetical protein
MDTAMSKDPRLGFPLALADLREKLARIPLVMLGTWYKGSRKFSITRENIRNAVANFRKRKADLVVDYEHASEYPEIARGEPIPAAGWLKSVDDGPDAKGILWGQAELTDDTRTLVEEKKLKYVSPCMDWTQRDRSTGQPQGLTFTSIALTNRPFLDALPALALSEIRGMEEGKQVAVNYDDDSNLVQIEIDRRIREMMAANRPMGYQAAFQAVMVADPKLADARWNAVQEQICGRVKELMASNKQLNYAAALDGVLREWPNLAREYRDARIGALSPVTSFRLPDDQLGVEIQTLVKGKLAASEGKGYGMALSEVLCERPDLARRYKDTMR